MLKTIFIILILLSKTLTDKIFYILLIYITKTKGKQNEWFITKCGKPAKVFDIFF